MTLELSYLDSGGKARAHAAYNRTVHVVDMYYGDAFDAETFFMYLMLSVLPGLAALVLHTQVTGTYILIIINNYLN